MAPDGTIPPCQPLPRSESGAPVRKEARYGIRVWTETWNVCGCDQPSQIRQAAPLGGGDRPLRNPGPRLSVAVRPLVQLRPDVRTPGRFHLLRTLRGRAAVR